MNRNEHGNCVLNEGFDQVCVWPGIVVNDSDVSTFESFFLNEMGVRVQFLEEIRTSPDVDKYGNPVLGTGGRADAFFAVHSDDVGKFALPRLMMGIRWIEDVFGNGGGYLYEDRVALYKTW